MIESQQPDKVIPRELFFNIVGVLSRYDGFILLGKCDGMDWATRLITESHDCPSPTSPEFADRHEAYLQGLKDAKLNAQQGVAQARTSAIYEVLKDFGYGCVGEPETYICDMCGAKKYCLELRSTEARK